MNLPHFTLKPENQSHLPVGRMTFTLQPLLLPDLILVPIGPLLIRIICVTPPSEPSEKPSSPYSKPSETYSQAFDPET